MNEKTIKGMSKEAFVKERSGFKTLLLSNPNYFGNLDDKQFKSVLPIKGNTFYEELGCVGYQPQQNHLEAVVYVYQPSGYGADICGVGTSEYVRFYLSFDNGASWQDEGMTSFQAHNIPEGTSGRKRLEYAVSLPVSIKRKLCFTEHLIQVRAILSWNNPPPANQPNWNPVWGNVNEATIQVEPRRFIFPGDFTLELNQKIPLLDIIEPAFSLPTKKINLDAPALSNLYKKAKVPVHRFAFKELMNFSNSKSSLTAENFNTFYPGIDISPDINDLLFPSKDGNISYEELKCIGLDPNTPDTLVGIVQVKKASGYSGGLCTNGSREHVTFWADFDGNGSFETCLGSTSVRTYDLSSIPSDGIHYAVRLPIDLDAYRQKCSDGSNVVKIRAILSWNVAAPCNNPNYIPAWGNREETIINVSPVAGAPAGKIAILGGIPVSFIDDASGMTTSDAVFATNNLPPDNLGRACPFGLRVSVQGAPLPGHSYKVEVTPALGGAPTPLVTKLKLTRSNGTTFDHFADVTTGRFNYVNYFNNVNGLLAQWDSTGDEKWIVKLTTYDAADTIVGTDTQMIQLDNTGPDASLVITSGAGDCGKFFSGVTISGDFVATDDNLKSYSLGVEPAVNPAGTAIPVPNSGLINTAPLPGNSWSLDTTGMKACGYVVRVVARDRSILNSQSVGHYKSASVGFCLEDNT